MILNNLFNYKMKFQIFSFKNVILIIAIVLSLLSTLASSASILLLFAGGNLSHKISVWSYVYNLAEAGHNVTFISSHHKTPKSHQNIQDVVSEPLIAASASAYNVDRFQERIAGTEHDLFTYYGETSLKLCDVLLSDPSIQKYISNPTAKYDLAIINAVYGECGLLIAEYLKVKFIVFDTTTIHSWFHTTYGLPWAVSWIPDMPVRFSNIPLGYIDRLRNFRSYYSRATRPTSFTTGLEELMRKYLDSDWNAKFIDIERNASLIFVNTHPAIDFARALPPMFIHVGGMQCWEKIGQLPQKFQEFMDDNVNYPDGILLIAFGSTINLNKLPPHYLNIFFNMMRHFSSVGFIWRWGGELPEHAPKNLLASDWLPQREILNHPRLRGFMTHCGYGSITEAVCYSIPMIAVPLFADQDLNSYMISSSEIGVTLEVQNLSQESMNHVVQEILYNPKYKKNMLARTGILKDRPMSPAATAVWWTEFVLRHNDTSSFKPMALREQSMFVRNLFDVYFTIFGVLFIAPLILIYIIFTNCCAKKF